MNDAYVIVGAGHAARRAAETLRERSPDIRIVMVGEETELPYDRPVLSKDALLMDDGEHRAFIRDANWYEDQRIELRLGMRVAKVNRSDRCVILDDGSRIGYTCLLLATGSRVRRFGGPVNGAVHIHYVRTVADARALRKALVPGARVTVLGGGFIGLEVAASARTRGCAVSLIEPADRLLQRSMPAEVGAFMLELHRRHGVDVKLATTPVAIDASANAVASIVTMDASGPSVIHADVVVVGIGVLPNVELAESAGLAVDNGILVDAHCRTSDPAIYAAGEVTNHFNPSVGRHVRVESWQVAENQPAVAAANMLGDNVAYEETPWLWSDQYDCNVQTLGFFTANQTKVVRGDPVQGSFCVLALDSNGSLAAAVTVNNGRDMGVCRRLVIARKVISPDRLVDPGIPLKTFLQQPVSLIKMLGS
ncbi:pyridine nucleotide-disulfide oxidoreductase [Burkholderia sp. Leaf177]|uniref:anthranilate 1,2-dioxygenase system ferredoxin--NAD(+) reductase n=1 Tax=Burkholderia sp. Leaf177 TaxID=1736287 RepID=UPI0006F334B2|nr:anthranilate 1,2-dioxygenase system ferredoxin--NAD(+) reductase [Burkholderia sp. Leaf177]KQR77167.1 pyridine nucleotide-disulfide oxidoreductase [Burkholderia sp. Leaf177]